MESLSGEIDVCEEIGKKGKRRPFGGEDTMFIIAENPQKHK